MLASHATRCLGRCPERPSERLPPSFLHASRSVQPVPREAAHSGCTPGLADGQGFSAALRCVETQAQGRTDHVSSTRHPVRPQRPSDKRPGAARQRGALRHAGDGVPAHFKARFRDFQPRPFGNHFEIELNQSGRFALRIAFDIQAGPGLSGAGCSAAAMSDRMELPHARPVERRWTWRRYEFGD